LSLFLNFISDAQKVDTGAIKVPFFLKPGISLLVF